MKLCDDLEARLQKAEGTAAVAEMAT